MRPEFQCSSFLPEDAPFEKKLLEHLAPGDAIVEWCGRSTAQERSQRGGCQVGMPRNLLPRSISLHTLQCWSLASFLRAPFFQSK